MIAKLALGPRAVRVDPELGHGAFELDDVAAIPALIKLGQETAESWWERLREPFFLSTAQQWNATDAGAIAQ